MNPIEFKIIVTESDYRAYCYFNIFKKRKWCLPLLIVVGILSIIKILQKIIGFGDVPNIMFYNSIIFLALVIFIFIVLEINIRRFINLEKLAISSERNIVINDEGFLTSRSQENNSTKYKWDTLLEVYDTKKTSLYI